MLTWRLRLLGFGNKATSSQFLERILIRLRRKERVLEKDNEESTTPRGSFGVESADAIGVINCRRRLRFSQTSPKNYTTREKCQYRQIPMARSNRRALNSWSDSRTASHGNKPFKSVHSHKASHRAWPNLFALLITINIEAADNHMEDLQKPSHLSHIIH